MTPVRAAAIVRGDVPGLLRRGMPVTFIGEGLDGEPVECVGVVLDDAEPNTTWRVANLTDGVPADLYGDETRAMQPLWTDPAAVHLSLHWLAEKGHPMLWTLPTTHGGRVEAWDGLTAWEVAAVLVSVSVGRVARGAGPIVDVALSWETAHGGKYQYSWKGWHRKRMSGHDAIVVRDETFGVPSIAPGWSGFARGPETGDAGKLAADRAAVADGCCLQVPGGLVVPT